MMRYIAGGMFLLASSFAMSSSASAALLCSSPQEPGLSLCYMVSSCTVAEDGSASGGGYTLNPGRCVGAMKKEKYPYTKSRGEFERNLHKAHRKFRKVSMKARPLPKRLKKTD